MALGSQRASMGYKAGFQSYLSRFFWGARYHPLIVVVFHSCLTWSPSGKRRGAQTQCQQLVTSAGQILLRYNSAHISGVVPWWNLYLRHFISRLKHTGRLAFPMPQPDLFFVLDKKPLLDVTRDCVLVSDKAIRSCEDVLSNPGSIILSLWIKFGLISTLALRTPLPSFFRASLGPRLHS